MSNITRLQCRCGEVEMEAEGAPIFSAECQCTSCRTAADIFEALPDIAPMREATGGIRTEMYRKDRVRCTKGQGNLREFRLTEKTKTRRVVAVCCNTPVFLDFTAGHWINLYSALWPESTRPPLQIRTMTGDLDDPSVLPNDVPNLKSHSVRFFVPLLGAWVAMGFRTPKVTVEGVLDV